MNKEQVSKLSHGLYRVFWTSGGSSLAAVGSNSNGDRWLSPTNWIGGMATTTCWADVSRVEKIEVEESHESDARLCDTLALFHKNLKATEAWYAGRAERVEADAYVVVQIATCGVAYCLELAMKGEAWTPAHAERPRA